MSNPIDTKVISKLAEILDKSNLTELEYEDEGCRISLSKNGGAAAPTFVPAPMPAAPAQIPGSGRSASGACRRQCSRRSG